MPKDSKNFLEFIPVRNPDINWSTDEKGKVTLEIQNKGIFNRIAQKLFKKPKISFIHMDETGSFVWPLIDGKRTVFIIGEAVREKFGDAAEPLYERLSKFFKILESYGFVKLD